MKHNLNKILAAAAAGLFSSQAHAEEAPTLPPQAAVDGITFEDPEARLARMGRGAREESAEELPITEPAPSPSLRERVENIDTTIAVAPRFVPGLGAGVLPKVAGERNVPGVEYRREF